MATLLARTPTAGARSLLWPLRLRPSEWIALGYFVWVALLSILRPITPDHRLLLLSFPIALTALCVLESETSRPWSRVLRDWLTLGTILVAYQTAGWFPGARFDSWQTTWVGFDRGILHGAGLQRAIEAAGPAIPFALETCYLLLYAIPPVSLGLVYRFASRTSVNRYLFVLLFGTFAAYAFLPLFPTISPRLEFPGMDVPNLPTLPRTMNIWVLDHWDKSTSVFPSGHVAVAFSSAFALLSVFPRRRSIWIPAFSMAAIIYTATIYGRYHYAVDGLFSIVVAFAAWRLCERQARTE